MTYADIGLFNTKELSALSYNTNVEHCASALRTYASRSKTLRTTVTHSLLPRAPARLLLHQNHSYACAKHFPDERHAFAQKRRCLYEHRASL